MQSDQIKTQAVPSHVLLPNKRTTPAQRVKSAARADSTSFREQPRTEYACTSWRLAYWQQQTRTTSGISPYVQCIHAQHTTRQETQCAQGKTFVHNTRSCRSHRLHATAGHLVRGPVCFSVSLNWSTRSDFSLPGTKGWLCVHVPARLTTGSEYCTTYNWHKENSSTGPCMLWSQDRATLGTYTSFSRCP